MKKKKFVKKPKIKRDFETLTEKELLQLAANVVHCMRGNPYFKEEQMAVKNLAEVLHDYEISYARTAHEKHRTNFKVLKLYRDYLIRHLNYVSHFVNIKASHYPDQAAFFKSAGFKVKIVEVDVIEKEKRNKKLMKTLEKAREIRLANSQ